VGCTQSLTASTGQASLRVMQRSYSGGPSISPQYSPNKSKIRPTWPELNFHLSDVSTALFVQPEIAPIHIPLSAFRVRHVFRVLRSVFRVLRSVFRVPHSAFRALIPDSALIASSFARSSPKLNHTFIYLVSGLPFDFCFSKQTLLNFP